MRRLLLLPLALAGCSAEQPLADTLNAQAKADRQAALERAAAERAVRAGFAPAQPAPVETNVAVDPPETPAPGAILPPATAQYRYIGRWAVTPELCADGGWRFQSRKLSTAGETSCDLPDVAATPAGYELAGTCRSEGTKTQERIRLTFDERARRMRIEARTLGPADLIYCGP